MTGLDPLELLLFVRGCGARSLDAIVSVRRVCDAAGGAPLSLRIIDVFNEPALVAKYRVVATPTLVTLGGSHERRLVGNLSEQSVRAHFELEAGHGSSVHDT
jgi:circadian clock protein KaiB